MTKLASLFLLLAVCAAADSLWSPDFKGYLEGGARVQEGDTVLVTFAEGFALSFKSAGIESKRLSLELSGGPYGDLLSFLPTTRTQGDRSVSGDSRTTLEGSLAVRVTGADGGALSLRGQRVVVLNGREESIVLTASVNVRDLSQGRSVEFSRLVDPRLVYRGPTEAAGETITAEDIIDLAEAPAAPAALPAAQPLPGAEAPAAVPPQPRARLTDERRRELLLLYINRMVDILF
jgi:hypothetical protein